jgi:hypothetical protein
MKKTPDLKKIFIIMWLSFTLSVLFFYPLIATLNDNDIILHWRIQNTLELLAVIAIMTGIFTAFLYCAERYLNPFLRLAVYSIIAIIPLVSFGVHFLQQLGYKEDLINLGQYVNMHKALGLGIGIFFVTILLIASGRYPSRVLNIILMVLITLSPMNILAGWTLWKLRGENTPVYLKKDGHPSRGAKGQFQNLSHNVIIFLFDELSYEYLYYNKVIRSEYPNIKYLSSISDNYHAATSPGNQTLTSLPGLLTGKKYENITMEYDTIYRITKKNKKDILQVDQNNLFSMAKQKGFRTLMFGPYLPYCELFGVYLDECRSFSIYNYGTIENNFSLLNPLLTTFNIWPRQYPQGLIKNRAASKWQKEQTEETYRLAMKAMDTHEPFLLFVHFYPPHLPFVFDKNGYYENKEPFLQNHENYSRQVGYVDRILGEFIASLKKNDNFERSIIIMLSDHNYRIMYPDRKNAIPLIVKGINQNHRRDIYRPVQAETLLMNKVK